MDVDDAVVDDLRVVLLANTGDHQEGDSRHAVEVTAAGVSGVYAPLDELPASLAAGLARHVVGHRVADHDGLSTQLLKRLGQHGAGLGRWAVGAVDCAVWDLHGRLAGLPVAALLADAPAAEVPVYASWLSMDHAGRDAENAVCRIAEQGFAFTKWSMRNVGDCSRMARTACRLASWTQAAVALDALGTWEPDTVAAMARLLSADAVRWVEDPLPRSEPTAYTELLAGQGLGIAVGERIADAEAARNLLALGPAAFTFDVAWCGGITEARVWMELARRAGVQVCLHGRAFVPALHVAAAFAETAGPVEYQVLWEPRRQRTLSETVRPDGGRVGLPDRPGLGVRVAV